MAGVQQRHRLGRRLVRREPAIKTRSGNAKTILQEAVRRKLIAENAFQHMKSGPTLSKCTLCITPAEITRITEACPDAEWKQLFGLARYAGLRIPSESQLLTWADVDWERGRLTVRSPKTEHHAGHEQRLVPVTPKLMTLLTTVRRHVVADASWADGLRGAGRYVALRPLRCAPG